jgi:5'-nucleotidase
LASALVWGASGRWFESSRPDLFFFGGSLLILLTNDDGYRSEGIIALKNEFSKTDEVWVLAPEREQTCISHAITLHKPLRITEHGERFFSTNGTPADAILLGLRVLLPRPPDLIISGINKGPNMGQDVSYSGTVAAAREGAFVGISAIACSLSARKTFQFDTAVRAVRHVVDTIQDRLASSRIFVNVNIPNVSWEMVKGFVVTSLGKRIYNGMIIERTDPRGGKYYWVGGDSAERFEPIEGTDLHAVNKGYVSITPLHWDTTSRVNIEKFEKIFQGG